MKKMILSFAAASVLALGMTSCADQKKDDAAATTTEQPAAPAPADEQASSVAATSTTAAPTFSSEEVNKGLQDYTNLLNEYTSALASKDQAKIDESVKKFTQWSQQAGTWASKLKPEETQQFTDYLMKLSKEWQEAAAKAAGAAPAAH